MIRDWQKYYGIIEGGVWSSLFWVSKGEISNCWRLIVLRRTLVAERVNMVIIGKYQFEIDPHLKLDDN